MNVEELQLHLTNLGRLLRDAGARKAADELDDFSRQLQPFRGQRLRALGELVARAEEIVRTGAAGSSRPVRPKPAGSGKADAPRVEEMGRRIVDVYHRATDPGVTREVIEAALADLEQLNPTMDRIVDVARQIGISRRITKKADALKAIREVILERKGAFERVHA